MLTLVFFSLLSKTVIEVILDNNSTPFEFSAIDKLQVRDAYSQVLLLDLLMGDNVFFFELGFMMLFLEVNVDVGLFVRTVLTIGTLPRPKFCVGCQMPKPFVLVTD